MEAEVVQDAEASAGEWSHAGEARGERRVAGGERREARGEKWVAR